MKKNKIVIPAEAGIQKCFIFLFVVLLSFSAFAEDPAQNLLEKAKKLDKMSDSLTEKAEKGCYWGKKEGSHDCMRGFVNKYNEAHGAGSFELIPELNIIRYTGVHFHQLMEKYPKSSYAEEADFLLLSKNLVGPPAQILPRVEAFLDRRSSENSQRKGKLLLARLNQDIWWIHKKWSWILYNWKISEEELQKKSELFRNAALKLFAELSSGNSEESKAARREAALLKANKDDDKIYGIINEALANP